MKENGISFQGPLNTNSEILPFSIDSKNSQPDEWYVAFQGVHQNSNPYLCSNLFSQKLEVSNLGLKITTACSSIFYL